MKTQFGRSMIEMLGVLAIIGVLSVGGLAGYTRAMRSNRVNNILDYVNRAWVEMRSKGTGIGEQDSEDCTTLTGESDDPTGVASCTCSRSSASVATCIVKITDGKGSELSKAFAARLNKGDNDQFKYTGSWSSSAVSSEPVAT